LDDIVGVTLEKQMIPTIANLTQTNLDDFIIVHPKDFVYNPRTHGKKIGLGFNTTDRCFISTWNNNTFRVKAEMSDVIIPEYLYMYFLRERWDKEACFNAWGSSTVVLLWSSFCDMKINVPPISEQCKIVHDYQVITDRIELLRQMNENLEDIAFTAYMSLIEEKNNECFSSTLGEVAVITTGKLNSEDAVNDGAYPFFTCSQETFRTDSYAFDQEAVLLAGNNASAVYPLKLFEGKFNAYQRTYVISSKNNYVSNKQLYFLIKNKLKDFKEQSYGTATKFLTMTILAPIVVKVPNKEVSERFSLIADTCFSLMATNKYEIDSLEKVKVIRLSNISKGA